MENEIVSLGDVGGAAASGSGTDKRGKHRIHAELERVEQEVKFLQEELAEIEQSDNVSTLCIELLHNVEIVPDPLLPETIGPTNQLWERWFERPQDSRRCQCWIL